MRNKYWAADKDTDTVVSKIDDFLSSFSLNSEADNTSLSGIWSRNLRMYYNNVIANDDGESSLNFAGEEGELIEMHIPTARSDIRKAVSIACRQRLHFKSQAESGEYTTKANTRVVDALAHEYASNDDIDLNGVRERALELAAVCGHSFIATLWDSDKERPVFKVIPPWMATYNYNVEKFDELDWFVVHYFVNRYTLAEQHPEYKEEILAASSEKSTINPWSINFGIFDYNEDDIVVSEFFHKSTSVLPEGRYIKFVGSRGIEDIPNPYLDKDQKAEIPVDMVCPEYIQPYLLGYPKICDILPLQEMTDHQFSVMATIFSALGVPTILNPRGSGINAANMSGLKVVSYSPDMGDNKQGPKPEVLELCRLPPNLLDTINIMQNFQSRISNISGALSGVLPPGVSAASAIATLSANAVEFIEPMSLSVHKALESAMTKAINQTAMFQNGQKVLETVGPRNVTAVLSFTGDDLKGLKRVKILTQNPLTLFAGGRQKIAEDYIKMGLITSPEQYDAVMVYGSLEPVRENTMTKESLVSWENEQMRQGSPVYALGTDDHAYHIYKHNLLLNDPEIRKRPELMQMVYEHMESHVELSRSTDLGMYTMAQTGQNIPPDQNTPTGMPEAPQQPVPQGGDMEGTAEETIPGSDIEGAEPAEPRNPAFDLGDDRGQV